MTDFSEQSSNKQKVSPAKSGEINSIQDFLRTNWMGLRPDLMLYPGPVDFDGQRSWILEDPVRGNNFRLGYAEGEFLYRLTTEKDIDSAVRKLYENTTLRPSLEEVVAFITMLQNERLAILPEDEVIKREAESKIISAPSLLEQLKHGNIFFRIPILRPDSFLTKTLPFVSLLWSPALRWFYLICGLTGLGLMLQEAEIYFKTVSYLFTPQGGLAFFTCLICLKTGHEFAHAYAAKAMGRHVRSMGVLFIIIWPLLYTDTTDIWKIPDRRQRIWVSAAGVIFELTVGGLALLLWAYLPDGTLRSIMFFLSGTSIVSSLFINLNPFMRYDGYYVLMDLWGIDNLRTRAFGLLRHWVRKLLFDWQGPLPDIHPHRRALIFYGFLALLYRLFIGISIAMAAYYIFMPALGIIIFAMEMWLFIIMPLRAEILAIFKNRQYWGSKYRIALTCSIFFLLLCLLIIPLPQMARIPTILLLKNATKLEAPVAGQLITDLPQEGAKVHKGDLLARVSSDFLNHQIQQAKFDLAKIRASITTYRSGGEEGAYRKWLIAEENRLKATLEKYIKAAEQLEIRALADGEVVDVNPRLYKGAFVSKRTYICTIADPSRHEAKAFVHEKLMGKLSAFTQIVATIRLYDPLIPELKAKLIEKSAFPVNYMPNNCLYDFAGGPIVSVRDAFGRRPKDAYFTFTFEVENAQPCLYHGIPAWTWLKSEARPVLWRMVAKIWEVIMKRGFF